MKAGDDKGARITAVVLDRCGNHIASISHPQATPITNTMAKAKAFTALNFDLATDEIVDKVDRDIQAKLAITDNRLLFLGGGMPIHSSSGIAGAIGVSGATPLEDAAIAKAALAVFT